VTDRAKIRGHLEELYSARIKEDLTAMCSLFSAGAELKILGASQRYPVWISARGTADIRETLSLLLRISKLRDYRLVSMIIDCSNAAVHWTAAVHSRVTPGPILTEFVDIVELSECGISAYMELFAPQFSTEASRQFAASKVMKLR
jgi:hypothetical protein